MSERRGGRFGWVLIGFGLGVLTTSAAVLFLNRADDGDRPEYLETTAADDAAAAAMQDGSLDSAPPPRRIQAAAAVVEPLPVTPAATPETQTPPPAPAPLDPQVADDAAAVGMTSRAQPN